MVGGTYAYAMDVSPRRERDTMNENATDSSHAASEAEVETVADTPADVAEELAEEHPEPDSRIKPEPPPS
jgi:hypothetical protein